MLVVPRRATWCSRVRPQHRHYNPIGSVHGGFHATLLDSCVACAVQTTLEAGQGYTTIELKVNYIRALTDRVGPVRAEGKVIHAGKQIGTAEGKLVDADGKLYAHATTTCLIFDCPGPNSDTYRGTVYPWHCDHMNHMNVMYYVGKFDEATWNLMSHIGMSAASCATPSRHGGGRPAHQLPARTACRRHGRDAHRHGFRDREEDHLLPRNAQCRHGRGVRDHAADRGAYGHPDTQEPAICRTAAAGDKARELRVWSPTSCPGSHERTVTKSAPAVRRYRVLGAEHGAELEQVRQFFRNYAGWLGVDLSFQNFDEEMANLPGRYAAPDGRLFYATVDGKGAGCVGIRPGRRRLRTQASLCRARFRGSGVGRDLALAAIRAARQIGYRKIMLDTLPAMRIAVKLYRELGFSEAPAYYQTPVEGTQFLALDLENWSEEQINNQNLHHLFDFNRAWARRCGKSIPAISRSCRTCRRRNTCGSAVPIRACRPTRSSACCRARSSSIAMSPTWWCTPTSTASR
jgi:uncharacterized protein (TIGR00369 family)